MKKTYLMALACGLAATAFAQTDYVTPAQVEYMVSQRVSPNGRYIAGQDVLGSVVYSYDVETGYKEEFLQYVVGNGNCVANNGMIVGQYYGDDMQAAVMYNGKAMVPPSLSRIGTSTLDAITPDGRRACGYRASSSSVMFVPFVVDIAEDGTFAAPIALPYPRKDFFGATPQWVNAVTISEDGKTIAGFVQDSSGFYSWPIIYTQGDDGKWSYSQPTESMFNPDNLELPRFPNITWGKDGAPAQPKVTDFMTEEEMEAWKEALKENPNASAMNFISDEGYARYMEAVKKFNTEANEFIDDKYDAYWRRMQEVGVDEQYSLNIMALSPDGKLLAADKGLNADEMAGDIMASVTPIIFNLEDETHTLYPAGEDNVYLVRQLLPDGTLVLSSSSEDFIPFVTYILMPGKTEYITFNEFLSSFIPAYLPWLEDSNLTQYGIIGYENDGKEIYGEYTITGYVSFSDRYETITGGVPLGDGLSYIYYKEGGYNISGVEKTAIEPAREEGFNVYNLNGVKLLKTDNEADLNNLPKGIYIINGKKVIK